MSVKLPRDFKVEPSVQEKSLSAMRVSRDSSIGNVIVLIIAQILSFKNMGSDRTTLMIMFLMLFLSAISLGSGLYALQGMKKQKAQIFALILICLAATVIFLKKNFG